ncbi:hypothetical protein PBV87_04215 [Niameybacter massiliensis]|uniref:Uncharacterized protein n=2 Tax=Lachnospirales TaxID=3085636 RepID=A0AA42DKT9_9FIRM|nr:hypothetical protein [Holtiella tumoricola]MDA3730704.1 hypothetical protein [Holtiella tumoricola]
MLQRERIKKMYLTELEWRGWYFYIEEDNQVFGKTKVIAERGDLEEIFYTTEDYLCEELCEDWYQEYLYMYSGEV